MAGGDAVGGTGDDRGQGRELHLLFQLGEAGPETAGELVCATGGLRGVRGVALAGVGLEAELRGAAVPEVDLALQPFPHRGPDLLHPGDGAGTDRVEVAGHGELDRGPQGPGLHVGTGGDAEGGRVETGELVCGRRAEVEVRGDPGVPGGARVGELHELEAAAHDVQAAVGEGPAVGDGVLQVHQDTRVRAGVGVVHEHGALLEELAVALHDEVEDRLQERVPGRHELRGGFAGGAQKVALETDPLVRGEHGGAGADEPVAVTDFERDTGELETAPSPCAA